MVNQLIDTSRARNAFGASSGLLEWSPCLLDHQTCKNESGISCTFVAIRAAARGHNAIRRDGEGLISLRKLDGKTIHATPRPPAQKAGDQRGHSGI